MIMSKLESKVPNERAGKQYRSNPDRYFHIMTEGWYIFTREGVKGPFFDKSRAAFYLQQHILRPEEQSDPSAGWRL